MENQWGVGLFRRGYSDCSRSPVRLVELAGKLIRTGIQDRHSQHRFWFLFALQEKLRHFRFV
jgi:hypothetical protein